MHALGTPLITRADGTKIGKTEGATVWLDPELTSPYAFFQYWLGIDDVDARAWLPLFSERPAEEVAALVQASAERPQAREAQRALAEDLTRLVHGEDELHQAEAAGRALFGRDDLAALGESTLSASLGEAGALELEAGRPRRGPVAVGRGAAAAHRAGQLAVRRATDGEGGRCLPQQRAHHRRRRLARPGRPAGRRVVRAAPGEAEHRRGPRSRADPWPRVDGVCRRGDRRRGGRHPAGAFDTARRGT